MTYIGDDGKLGDNTYDSLKNQCVKSLISSVTSCNGQGELKTVTATKGTAGTSYFCVAGIVDAAGGGDTGDTTSTPGTTDDTTKEPDVTACDLASSKTSIVSLKWIVCPIIEGGTFLMGQFDDFLNSQLKGDMSAFDKNGPYHVAWNSFRVMALGLVVIAALIMVISQATGLELMDAYTTRKVLPVLLASAIMIGLSWDVLKIFYGLSNDATTGVRTIIYAPFQGFNQIELGGGSSFSLILLGSGAALALGWMGLLSFVATGVLAVALALLALLLIHTASYALLVVSPLAIACAILPNTRKAYEFWKGATISLLIAPVAVATVIAIFRVAAVISYNAPGNTTIHQLVAIILYFAADFMTIWVISRIGGAAAMLTGVVNDRSRGAFDRLKNFRGKKVGENMSAMKAGTRFSDNNPLSRTFNTTTQGLGTGWKGRFGMGGRGDEARDQNMRNSAANIMKGAAYQSISEDDDALRAASYGSAGEAMTGMKARLVAQGKTEEQASVEARRAVQAVQTSIGFGRAQQFASAQGMANTGTGYDNMEDMVQTLGRASGGNASTAASLAGYANFKNKETKRHDLAPGFGNLYGAVRKEAGIDPGGPTTTKGRQQQLEGTAVQNPTTGKMEWSQGLNEQSWNSADPVTLMRDRKPAFQNSLNHWEKQYTQGYTDYRKAEAAGKTDEMDVALKRVQKAHTAFQEMEQSKMYGSGENVQIYEEAKARLSGHTDASGTYQPGHMDWLKSKGPTEAGAPSQVSYYERGDNRNGENPDQFYQRFRNNSAAEEANAKARMVRSPDPNRGDI
jgi:hypothetical protein